MNKRMINGFFSNKEFFLAVGIFAGLFVLVALAYLFADDKLGGHSKEFKGFFCAPEGGTCAGGVRVFSIDALTVGDGCKKTFFGFCTGTCYWCEPSNDRGRYCKEMIEYPGTCVVDIPNTPMSCGPSRPHKCQSNGGHGTSGCCPDEDKTIDPDGNCDNIATCIDIDD